MKKTALQTIASALLLIISLSSHGQEWKSAESQKISNSYIWSYGGRTFAVTIALKRSDYEYYLHLSKDMPYGRYCEEYEGHRYIAEVAKQLDDIAAQQGYIGERVAGFIQSFVHCIPYAPDPKRPNGGDYPRFPIETLVESQSGSDCEDHATLACSLLATLGQDVVLVDLWKSHHMAAAVASDNARSFYVHDGKRYAYMETVPCDLGIGQQPRKYRRETVGLISVPCVASYQRTKPAPLRPSASREPGEEWDREDYEQLVTEGVSNYGFSVRFTSDWHLTVMINGWTLISI